MLNKELEMRMDEMLKHMTTTKCINSSGQFYRTCSIYTYKVVTRISNLSFIVSKDLL